MLGVALGSTTSFGQTITGTVYRDFNGDGAYTSIPASGTYAYGEPGVSGMTVTAYSSNSATAPVSTTTNANGSYTLTVGSTSQFRVEFTNLVAGDYESFRGTGSATSVQFVNGGSTNVNLGVNYPANYCQSTTPELVTTCFISINATNNPTLQSRPVLVGVPYTVDDDTKTVTDYATEGEIGAAWGVAYKKDTKQLFESAFTKRHVGFSAGGPNAIYVTNITSTTAGNTTEFFNFTTVGGTAVTSTTETHGTDLPTGLTNSSTSSQLASHDNVAFDAVGKTSLGDIEMSDDGKTLYVVNLKDRKLYSIDVATKVATGVAIPNPGCTTSGTAVNGSYRPFALKYYKGLIYVGVVCTREDLGSTTVAYGSTPGLSATVYAVDPATLSTFTTVLSFPLTYKKQPSDADKTGQAAAEYWRPWTSIFQADRTDGPYSYPQAWLTGIEFEPGTGDMILGLRDRFGDQIGYQNYIPFSTGTTLISAISPGEILRARKCTTTAVTWTLESGGALCNTTASATQAAQQGPGDGKYYWGDRVQNGANHGMSSQGALAQLGGSEDVAMTAIDPTDVFNTGGIKRLHNDTGAKDGNATGTAENPGAGAELYGSDAFGYGKANGLGDLEVLCNLAPVEIGNRVWVDANNNGIQDPGELPLAGVKVTLTGPGITGSVSVTTNAAGEYYFSSASGTAATGFAYSLTGLTGGGSYSLTFPTSASAGALTLSGKPNSATGTNADNIDTDPNSAGVISFTLGQAGQNNFSYDAGYVPPASLGDYVFEDKNANGIQDAGDTPIAGVKVTLYTNGVASATTVTNASGLYSFTGLTPGSSFSYSVGFTAPAGYTATQANIGSDDTKDSDGNPSTGLTGVYSLTAGEYNPTIDMGYVKPASLGDYVFVDANKDGIQDTGDTPIPGVVVTLYTNGVASATTVTDASGLYSFTGLTPGTSLSYSVGFATPTGYTATTPLSGTDKTKDSDADLITGKTQSITLASGENNPTLDAGFYLLPAGLGDYVFLDANKDGIQNTGDTPIPGVVVTLYTNGVASATTVTNASGLYSFTGLTPGTSNSYVVGFTAPAGLTATLANAGTDDTKDSDADPITGKTQSVTLAAGEFNPTLDAGFYTPTAGLGDYVFFDANKDGIQNTGDTPIAGVTVTLYTNGVASATTVTNASGLYSFTGLTPGSSNSYAVGFTAPAGMTATLANAGTDDTKDSDADPITGKTQSVTLAPNEFNPTLDAGFYIPSAGLGDYVFLDANKDGIQNTGDTPIAGVVVTLYTNGVASATTVTNASGLYSFTGLTPGSSNSYVVGFTAPAGMTATLANAGTDNTKDSDADVVTGKTQSVTLAAGEFNPTLDAGYYTPTAGLGDYVFFDANKDGIQNTGDTPIAGVVVTLYTNGVASATTVTNASGLYSFTGLTPGTSNSYVVGFTAPAGMTATLANAGTDDTLDSDADVVTGKTQSVTLAPGEFNPTLDAGFYIPSAGLGDYVFLDANKDGIQNTGDTPIAGVVVTLYTNGVASATTVTNASGLYSFTGLTPGSSNSYVVGFTAPAGMTATLANAGTDDTKDSDADVITGKTQSVTLAPSEFNPTLDAGFYTPTAGLGDYVFLDANKDGIQNTGDTPIPGVVVTLYTNGVASATTVTNASGLYSFTGLTPGSSNSYVVGFTAPTGMTATLANAGTDDTLDSDADVITGKTQSVTLAAGEFNPTLDAGFYTPKAKSPKLTITKQVDKSKAKLHDVLTYTLAVTNSGDADANNILVTDSTSTGLTYVINSATNPAGTTFTQGTPISTWTIGTLTAGQSLSMTFQATADSSGILYNKAIVAGDTATVCTSIPVVMCAGDVYTFQLTAPAGRSSYQWFKDGVAISGQTTNVLEVTAPGTYSLAVDNTSGKCPDFSCCPFIIEEDSLPSFKAIAVPVTCTGSTTLANGQIVLSGFNAANTYQYSLGSSFNAAASLSGVAKVIPGDGLLVGNLSNPSVATAYTIRVYNASGCYTDVTVLLMPTVCGCPADICVPFVLSQTKRAPRIGDAK